MKKDLRFQTIIAFIFMKDNSTSEIVNRQLLDMFCFKFLHCSNQSFHVFACTIEDVKALVASNSCIAATKAFTSSIVQAL